MQQTALTPLIVRLQRMTRADYFRAFTLRGDDSLPIDPFLGVDHAWVSAPTFAPHPHAGFSAVSYLFFDSETVILNRDSRGTENRIAPGGLHWTAAGSGVVHEEVPAETGKTVHMLQIFVNLPQARQGDAPFALSLAPEDVPVLQLPGARIRVPLGRFGQTSSPLNPPTEVTLLDLALDDGAELAMPIEAGHSAFIMPVQGTLSIAGDIFHSDEPRLPLYPEQAAAQSVTLKAIGGHARVVMFSGKPLKQAVHWQGPMAFATPERLAAAISAYQRGEFGAL